jgi:hypothetical protein
VWEHAALRPVLFTFLQSARPDTGKLASARNRVISERDSFMLHGIVLVFNNGGESWAWVNPIKIKVKSTGSGGIAPPFITLA